MGHHYLNVIPRGRSWGSPILNIAIYIEMRDKIETIGILSDRKKQIKKLAKKYGYSDTTTLEYLLKGIINLDEL